MSMQRDFDRMIARQGLGHSNFPVFTNPLMLGDVVQFRPAQKVTVKRRFNVFENLGMNIESFFSKAELDRPLPLNASLELKSESGVLGGANVSGGSPVEGGKIDASISVTFKKSNSFYLYAPVYMIIGISDRDGFGAAVAKKAKGDKAHSVGIADHIIDKVMVAISPAKFLAARSTAGGAKVTGKFTSTAPASVDGSFNMSMNTSDVQASDFQGIGTLPMTLRDYLKAQTMSNGVFAFSSSRFKVGGKTTPDN